MDQDILVGRKGESLTGKVRNKSFTIDSALGRITVRTDQINQIRFKKPQEITLLNRDVITGAIMDTHVAFKRSDGVAADIPVSAILYVLIGWSLGGPSLTTYFED